MTKKSPGLTLLEGHNLNRWAAKNPDQLLWNVDRIHKYMIIQGVKV